jgi:hypothetical protein
MMSDAGSQRGKVNAKRSIGNAYQPFRCRFVDPIGDADNGLTGDKTFDQFVENRRRRRMPIMRFARCSRQLEATSIWRNYGPCQLCFPSPKVTC